MAIDATVEILTKSQVYTRSIFPLPCKQQIDNYSLSTALNDIDEKIFSCDTLNTYRFFLSASRAYDWPHSPHILSDPG